MKSIKVYTRGQGNPKYLDDGAYCVMIDGVVVDSGHEKMVSWVTMEFKAIIAALYYINRNIDSKIELKIFTKCPVIYKIFNQNKINMIKKGKIKNIDFDYSYWMYIDKICDLIYTHKYTFHIFNESNILFKECNQVCRKELKLIKTENIDEDKDKKYVRIGKNTIKVKIVPYHK